MCLLTGQDKAWNFSKGKGNSISIWPMISLYILRSGYETLRCMAKLELCLLTGHRENLGLSKE